MKKPALVFLVVALVTTALPAIGGSKGPSNIDPPIISWQPPTTFSAASTGRASYAEIGGGPVPFFPITPCRQYDSRNTTALPDDTPRTVPLSGAPCGIPANTNAVAVNITVFNIVATSNAVFRVGTTSPPTTAWLNYPPSEVQRANAGAVATNGTSIVVQVNQGSGSVDFTVDVFGYYYNGNASTMPTGDSFDIWGDKSGGAVIFGRNDQATAANSFGVRGATSSTGKGSAGVEGEANGATGVVFGVLGLTANTSLDSAGVKGIDGTGGAGGPNGVTGYISAGVRGESHGYAGVLGFSNWIGVQGALFDNGGNYLAGGTLGTSGYGVYANGDTGASGTKSFVEPHPTDASKVIKFVSLEGPEAGTYFRGSGQIENGVAVIDVPDYFRWVTDESGLTVHITPVGGPGQIWVESRSLDRVVVRSSRNVDFDYIVHGVRKAYRNWQVVVDGNEYMPRSTKETLPAYLSEEAKRRLIQNGTYNADGTVNTGTAERLGWTTRWADHGMRPQEVNNSTSSR